MHVQTSYAFLFCRSRFEVWTQVPNTLYIFFLLLDTHSNITLYILSIAYHSIVNMKASRAKTNVPAHLALHTSPPCSLMVTRSIPANMNSFKAYSFLGTCSNTVEISHCSSHPHYGTQIKAKLWCTKLATEYSRHHSDSWDPLAKGTIKCTCRWTFCTRGCQSPISPADAESPIKSSAPLMSFERLTRKREIRNHRSEL